MKKAILGTFAVIVAGCMGASADPVGGHEAAVVAAASAADVAELGIDASGCSDAAEAGGTAVPVTGRPDLVAVSLGGTVVCLTTVEHATGANLAMSWLVDLDTLPRPMSNDPSEPEPQPYDEDDEAGGETHSEPEPQPYDGGKDEPSDGDDEDGAPDE